MDPPELTNKPIMKETITVNSIRINNLTEEDFAFKAKPGAVIYTRDGKFRVPGRDDELLTDFAQLLAKKGYAVPRPHRTLRTVLVVGNIVFLAGIVLVWWMRRRRRSKS